MTTKQKYGIRKLSVGAASCFLGSVLYFSGGMAIHAEEVQPTDVTPVAEETTVSAPATEMPEVPTVAEPTATPSEESVPAQEVATPLETTPTESNTTLQVQAANAINVRGISGTEEEVTSGIGATFKDELTKIMDQENIRTDYTMDTINGDTEVSATASGDFVVTTHAEKPAIGIKFDGSEKTNFTGQATMVFKDAAFDKYQKPYDLVFNITGLQIKYADHEQFLSQGVKILFHYSVNHDQYFLNSDSFILDENGVTVGGYAGTLDVDFNIYLVDKNGNIAKSGLMAYGMRDLDQGLGSQNWTDLSKTEMIERMSNDWGEKQYGTPLYGEAVSLKDGVLTDVFTTKYAVKHMLINEDDGYIGPSTDPSTRADVLLDSFKLGRESIDDVTLDHGFLTFVDASGFSATWHGNMNVSNEDGELKTFGHMTGMFEDFSNVLPAEPDTLRYEPNGGTGEMTNTDGYSGEFVNVKENEFIRDGYTFIGWNTKADGSGETVTTEYLLVEDFDDVVYAQWEKIPTTEWVDEEGNPLKDPEEGTFPDKEGDDIPGYKLTEIKTEEGTTINVYHKVQTHWVDEQGNPLKDSVDGTFPDKEGDDISGWEIVRTYVNDKGDTVNVYKKKPAPAAPKAQPATPAPAPVQTGMESGIASIASMAGTMFASLGVLVGLKKKKEN